MLLVHTAWRWATAMVGMNNGADASRTEILLVDDERVLVDLLAFIVQQAGLVPLVATEPTGAIKLFEREDPLVAVIDLNLKPWDGFELLADLRRRSASLPIIVLTARRSEDERYALWTWAPMTTSSSRSGTASSSRAFERTLAVPAA